MDMVDNEKAIAELLYTMWRGNEAEPEWSAVPRAMQFRWMRVARYVMHREVDLTAKLARESFRKGWDQRLLERLARWQRGQ